MSAEQTDTATEGGGEDKTSTKELPRRDLEEEFNVQRAKMKELFLQKEEDMRKMLQDKEHLESEVLSLRAELQQLQTLSENQKSEIQSLQLLVNETVEASSSGTEELRCLTKRNLELEQQIRQMQIQQQQQEVSLAPATLVRTLARKLGADAEVEQPTRRNMEDNEQSIIEPLELEIAALKNKLRETDTQLQEALKTLAASPPTGAAMDGKTDGEVHKQCDMCVNYEKQLVGEQAQAAAARDRATGLEQALAQATEELEGVRSLHDETVRAWHAARAAAAAQLEELGAAVSAARGAVAARAEQASAAAQRALHHVTLLTVDRETLQGKLDSLERDNATLLGRYLKKAEEMQNEIIDLPDDVQELQELTLRLREQLISCCLSREQAAAVEQQQRLQLLQQSTALQQHEERAAALAAQLHAAQEELDKLQTERSQMNELADKLRHSNDMIEGLLEDKKRLQSEAAEMRSRVAALQLELDNSEKVQQDFVRLSQSLQVQLQRIREADTEVRWQHEDDVHECPSCRQPLPSNKKKVHCRHCGRIFCAACVSARVPAGPRRLPARVCSVCRTLLQPHAAPYFCTQPPSSPD
ncbi:rab GTPase-binding effector protein 1 isoform X3 [Bombyx mandarina]|uniref:Rab GTPase-binding effector protein 1 isoform X3 n=1 Tax=Bombyx mandarina TaxID=7092 RepID=A0A6J2KDN9_BOMMA|nr:rab GTPase-binding effector protein 1 isoform X3 [Bombyx mandarina]